MKEKWRRSLYLLPAAAALAACCGGCEPDRPRQRPAAGVPNPASVHCVEQGGTLEIRKGPGGESGFCVFEDGSECEEWALFRGECRPGG